MRSRRRLLVLALVALAALPPISLAGPQDRTRYELTRHVALHGSIEVEPDLFDRAVYHGRSYSDKPPGLSFLAIPAFEVERATGIAKAPRGWASEGDASLWLLRVLTTGVLFLGAVWLVGSAAGTFAAAVYGAATLAAPLAPTLFDHDAAAAFAVAAFVLLWKVGRPLWAGIAAGFAVCISYQAAIIAAVLLAYAAWRYRRGALLYLAGLVPGAVALGAYNQAAFGSPFHLSYRYVANPYAEQQRNGFFGVGVPTPHGLFDVLLGSRGLLIWSPVCLVAAVGLFFLADRAAAVAAAAIVALFVLLNAGYFLPYGGGSPGPRFLGESLPFLALGLGPAFERFRRVTVTLALVSAVTMSVQALSWGVRSEHSTAYLPGKNDVMATIWFIAGLNRNLAAALVAACAVAAIAVAARR